MVEKTFLYHQASQDMEQEAGECLKTHICVSCVERVKAGFFFHFFESVYFFVGAPP